MMDFDQEIRKDVVSQRELHMAEIVPVCDRIVRFFAEKMHLEIPSVETDLFETGALDSLAFVELLLNLEQEFGVKVSLDELEVDNFRSIARIAQFVCNGNGSNGNGRE